MFKSNSFPAPTGVPQGSVFSPFLFISFLFLNIFLKILYQFTLLFKWQTNLQTSNPCFCTKRHVISPPTSAIKLLISSQNLFNFLSFKVPKTVSVCSELCHLHTFYYHKKPEFLPVVIFLLFLEVFWTLASSGCVFTPFITLHLCIFSVLSALSYFV